MPSIKLKSDALVIYKDSPARVMSVGDKIEITTIDGKSRKVREKDVIALHPGPLKSFAALQGDFGGDVEGAWELLLEEPMPLTEVAELIHEEFTPRSAYHVWSLLKDGLRFEGDMDMVTAVPPERVEAIEKARNAKETAIAEWKAHLDRVKSGSIESDDEKYLQDIERLAYGESESNRTLKELAMPQTREKAHELLLKLKFWDETVDPHPRRAGLTTSSPDLPVPEPQEEELEDLTDLAAFAIDDEGCDDPDDAVSVDGDALWVHVADVSSVVAPDDPIDLEARLRGANLYLPTGTATMLPPLVTERFGLGLDETSRSMSVKIRLNENDDPVCERIALAKIRVSRDTYDHVSTRMDEEPFRSIHALTRRFRAKCETRGRWKLDLPEVKVRVIEDSVQITPLPSISSRDMVTDAMLMAGRAVAKFAAENEIAIPYSTQTIPEGIEERPTDLAGMFACRKLMKRTEQHLSPGPHASLGLDLYTRLTSPLRRYGDLLVHQQLRAFLQGRPAISADDLLLRVAQGDHGAAAARSSERDSNRHWTLVHLARQPDWRGTGILVEKRDDRGVVIIPELALEFKIRKANRLEPNEELSLKLNRIDLPFLDVFMIHSRD